MLEWDLREILFLKADFNLFSSNVQIVFGGNETRRSISLIVMSRKNIALSNLLICSDKTLILLAGKTFRSPLCFTIISKTISRTRGNTGVTLDLSWLELSARVCRSEPSRRQPKSWDWFSSSSSFAGLRSSLETWSRQFFRTCKCPIVCSRYFSSWASSPPQLIQWFTRYSTETSDELSDGFCYAKHRSTTWGGGTSKQLLADKAERTSRRKSDHIRVTVTTSSSEWIRDAGKALVRSALRGRLTSPWTRGHTPTSTVGKTLPTIGSSKTPTIFMVKFCAAKVPKYDD